MRSAGTRQLLDVMLRDIENAISAYNKLERNHPGMVDGYPYWCQISLHHDEHLDTNEKD